VITIIKCSILPELDAITSAQRPADQPLSAKEQWEQNGISCAEDAILLPCSTLNETVFKQLFSNTIRQPVPHHDSGHAPCFPVCSPAAAQITAYFAEFNATAAGQRLMNYVINAQTMATNVDIFALGGGQASAVSLPVQVYSGSRSNFDVSFPTIVSHRASLLHERSLACTRLLARPWCRAERCFAVIRLREQHDDPSMGHP
jgi:hypothetical protein